MGQMETEVFRRAGKEVCCYLGIILSCVCYFLVVRHVRYFFEIFSESIVVLAYSPSQKSNDTCYANSGVIQIWVLNVG